jgi:hypothetical protein
MESLNSSIDIKFESNDRCIIFVHVDTGGKCLTARGSSDSARDSPHLISTESFALGVTSGGSVAKKRLPVVLLD